jgi:hypothetical protein
LSLECNVIQKLLNVKGNGWHNKFLKIVSYILFVPYTLKVIPL